MEKIYDVMTAVDDSLELLSEKINRKSLKLLVKWTRESIDDYDTIRNLLIEERTFFSNYLNDKRILYDVKFNVEIN